MSILCVLRLLVRASALVVLLMSLGGASQKFITGGRCGMVSVVKDGDTCSSARDKTSDGASYCGVAPAMKSYSSLRPQGCYCRDNKLFFNTASTVKDCSLSNRCICIDLPPTRNNTEPAEPAVSTCSLKLATGATKTIFMEGDRASHIMDCPCCRSDDNCATSQKECNKETEPILWVLTFVAFFCCCRWLVYIPCFKNEGCVKKTVHQLTSSKSSFGDLGQYEIMSQLGDKCYSGVRRIQTDEGACRFLDTEGNVLYQRGTVSESFRDIVLEADEYIASIPACCLSYEARSLEFHTNKGRQSFLYHCKSEGPSIVDVHGPTNVIHEAGPGFMIVGLQFDDSGRFLHPIRAPISLVYGSRSTIGPCKALVKKRKICRNIFMETLVIVLDIISLTMLWAAFSPSHSGWMGYAEKIKVSNISTCVSNWNNVVKPCLLSLPKSRSTSMQRDPSHCCGCGYVHSETFMTFTLTDDGKEMMRSLETQFEWYIDNRSTIQRREVTKNIMTNVLRDVSFIHPKSNGGLFDTRVNIPDSVALNMKPEHEHCALLHKQSSSLWQCIFWLTVWKGLHITLEMRLLFVETMEESGAQKYHHVHRGKFRELMSTGLKSLLTLLITIPSNYMYASLTTIGQPLTQNVPVGEASFTGAAIFKPPTLRFMEISTVSMFTFFVCLFMGCCLAANQEKNGCDGPLVFVLLFPIPLLTFQVMILSDLFDEYAGKAINLYNLLFSISFAGFGVFNTDGLAVTLAGVRFASNCIRYVVFILHWHPENVVRWVGHCKDCKRGANTLIRGGKFAARTITKKNVEEVAVRTLELGARNAKSIAPLINRIGNFDLPLPAEEIQALKDRHESVRERLEQIGGSPRANMEAISGHSGEQTQSLVSKKGLPQGRPLDGSQAAAEEHLPVNDGLPINEPASLNGSNVEALIKMAPSGPELDLSSLQDFFRRDGNLIDRKPEEMDLKRKKENFSLKVLVNVPNLPSFSPGHKVLVRAPNGIEEVIIPDHLWVTKIGTGPLSGGFHGDPKREHKFWEYPRHSPLPNDWDTHDASGFCSHATHLCTKSNGVEEFRCFGHFVDFNSFEALVTY